LYVSHLLGVARTLILGELLQLVLYDFTQAVDLQHYLFALVDDAIGFQCNHLCVFNR